MFPYVPNIPIREWSTEWDNVPNHALWLEVSTILIHVFTWAKDQDEHYFPLMSDLIFRSKNDFFGNTWSHFIPIWQPFIQQLELDEEKDKVLDLLYFGADTWSGSRPVNKEDPAKFR